MSQDLIVVVRVRASHEVVVVAAAWIVAGRMLRVGARNRNAIAGRRELLWAVLV